MDSPQDRVRLALELLDDANLALILVRPAHPVDRVASDVAAARDALSKALSQWEDADRKDEDMRRRDLLKLAGYASTAAVVPYETLERLAAALTPVGRVDGPLLDTLALATTSYAKGYYVARPADLLGVVRVHLNRLAGLAHASMTTGQSQRLGSMTSDTAALAGSLAWDADRRGESNAYFALSRDSAREAGDATLHALAIASIGMNHDDPAVTSWHLRQAVGWLPEEAPDSMRAWLHALHARSLAAQGEHYGFHAAIEAVDVALDRWQQDAEVDGFWSDQGWFAYLGLPGWRDDYHAQGLAHLGHDDAADALVPLIAQAADRRQVARLHVSLAGWHLDREEPAQAAMTAAQALGGTRQWDGQVRALRGRLEPWADLPEVRDLDEALILAA